MRQIYLVRYSVSATGTPGFTWGAYETRTQAAEACKVCAAFENVKWQVWIEAIDFHPAPVEVR